MRTKQLQICTLIILLFVTACSKDDGVTTPESPLESSEKQITAFVFRADNNTALTMDINANINETDNRITATVPFGTDISALRPEIAISDKASVSNGTVNDFTEIVKITVTAEDGSTATYDVVISIEPNNANTILSFTFSLTENPIAITIVGEIDEENQTITFETPLGTDISSLLPQIQTSTGAGFSPEGRQDFNELVVYTVTAENGAEKSYDVIWEISQRDILLTLYNENPENTLSWDLENPDITTWEGVTTSAEGNVIRLDLDGKGLENLPKTIGRLAELTILNASFNAIVQLPESIGALTNLTSLQIVGNALTLLPSEIGQLTQLQLLNVGGNELTSIPPEVGLLSNLFSLFVGGNELTELPVEIGLLTNLIDLSIISNQLSTLPEALDQLSIISLNLSNNNFVVVPSWVFGLPNLEAFTITNNPLASLPSAIGEAKKLKTLTIGETFLSQLPNEIGDLESLTSLSLTENNITTIPNTIGQLTNLEFLELSDNQLTTLPQEIGQLTQLKELFSFNNQLVVLPSELGQLGQLENLLLDVNQLTEIPEEIAQLTGLRNFTLTGNPDLTSIPQAVCDLENTGTAIVLDPVTVCQ